MLIRRLQEDYLVLKYGAKIKREALAHPLQCTSMGCFMPPYDEVNPPYDETIAARSQEGARMLLNDELVPDMKAETKREAETEAAHIETSQDSCGPVVPLCYACNDAEIKQYIEAQKACREAFKTAAVVVAGHHGPDAGH